MSHPTLSHQAGVRTALRVAGLALLVLGIATAVVGLVLFLRGFLSSAETDPGNGPLVGVLLAGGGGICAVLGLGALSFGFLGAQARYLAGETMPVVRDAASYVTDREGGAGTGRASAEDGPRQ